VIECATVGWLLKEDDDLKVICQSVGDIASPKNAQARGIMTIPARSVLSIEVLEEVSTCPACPESAARAGAAADLETANERLLFQRQHDRPDTGSVTPSPPPRSSSVSRKLWMAFATRCDASL
jgi:hypothetical protein